MNSVSLCGYLISDKVGQRIRFATSVRDTCFTELKRMYL